MAPYKTYSNIQIDGAPDYIAGVTGCLDIVDSIADGKKLLTQINGKSHSVTIQHTTTGNACAAQGTTAFPLILMALQNKDSAAFKSELNAAVNKSKIGGLTLEHLARQLSIGLTPATYRGA